MTDLCFSIDFRRFSGPKPCDGQLRAGSHRRRWTGDHADHQQFQPVSSPCFSFLLQHRSRKPSGDHPHHIRYDPVPLYAMQVNKNDHTNTYLYTPSLSLQVQKQTINNKQTDKRFPQGSVTHLLISSLKRTQSQAEKQKNRRNNNSQPSFILKPLHKSRLKASVLEVMSDTPSSQTSFLVIYQLGIYVVSTV